MFQIRRKTHGQRKLPVLALQRLHPLVIVGRRATPDALVALSLPNPVVKRLRRAAIFAAIETIAAHRDA
jgi:hypothetical protein